MIITRLIGEMQITIERRDLQPGVPVYMVSAKGDPAQFPIIHRPEFGGWLFVDKMTPIDFVQIGREIGDVIEKERL